MLSKMLELARNFTKAAPMDPSKLKALDEVRGMCAVNTCKSFNANWACPPGCGSVIECGEKMNAFKNGVIVQTVGYLEDEFDAEGMEEAGKTHKLRFAEFAEKARELCPDCLPLSAGACTLCKTCAYPEPCRLPDKMLSSMEAYGLFVSQVCTDNGISYYNGPNTIAYTSCILF